MKKILAITLATIITATALTQNASAGQFVSGYFKGNGTYVMPYFRSSPDGYTWNNYSNWN